MGRGVAVLGLLCGLWGCGVLPGVHLPVPEDSSPPVLTLSQLDGPLVSGTSPAPGLLPALCPDVAPVVSPPPPAAPVLQAAVSAPRLRAPAPVRSPSPLHVIQESMLAARIGPGQPGYQQLGAMHVYQYAPGMVYDLYVSSSSATGLLFPPGDFIKVGLFLPKELFDVDTKTAGEEQHAYDAVSIHPKGATGTYDAFILMTSGRAYLFRIIVGKKGMLTVRFTVPAGEPAP